MITTSMSASKKISSSFLLLLLIFHLLSAALAATDYSPSEIAYDISPFIIVYKNGTVDRLMGTDYVPPSYPDPKTGVWSKDVLIDPLHNVPARLYLPMNAFPSSKLPFLLYTHGGSFFVNHPYNTGYHDFMNSLVAEANVVALAVDYKLAPENPLPIGYEDSYKALLWALSGADEWIKYYVDFEQVYVGGDSAGGNIAHNVVRLAGLHGIMLKGMFLNCPHFFGTKLIRNESSYPAARVQLMDLIWIHAYPTSPGLDDPVMNPAKDPYLSDLGTQRVLVHVAELDFVRDRGFYYARSLRKSGWPGVVKVVEVMGEDHVFNLNKPNDPKSKKMLEELAKFLNGGLITAPLSNIPVASE